MGKKIYKIKSKVWTSVMKTTWYFLTIDKELSKEIKKVHGKVRRGFGSIPVTVTIGKTNWTTSIFFSSRSQVYVLPLKVLVRRKEDVFEGDEVDFTLKF